MWWVWESRRGQNGAHLVVRGRSEEAKAAKNGLMWEACMPLRVMVTSRPELLPKAMPGSVTLPQPWSVLMSVAPVITKGLEDTQGLGSHMCHVSARGPCHHRGHPYLSGLCTTGGHGGIWTRATV